MGKVLVLASYFLSEDLTPSSVCMIWECCGKINATTEMGRRCSKRHGQRRLEGARSRISGYPCEHALAGSGVDRAEEGRQDGNDPRTVLDNEIEGTLLGTKHTDTLEALEALGVVLGNLGRFEEADKMLQQVLTMHRKILGGKQPDNLGRMCNLAVPLTVQE